MSLAAAAAPASTQLVDHIDQGRQLSSSTSFDIAAGPVCATPNIEDVPNRFDLELTSAAGTQTFGGSPRSGAVCTDELPAGPVTFALTASGGPPGASLSLVLEFAQDVAQEERWVAAGRLALARDQHTATELKDGSVLITGGWSPGQNTPRADAEIFDPATGTSEEVDPMRLGRVGHRATLLPDGRVLVTGGDLYIFTPTPIAEIFDPETGRWSVAGLMTQPRYDHTAVLLPTGEVLLAGGGGTTRSPNSAEIFDPKLGVFRPTLDLPGSFLWHGSTQMADGRVLLAGGGNGRAAAIYDPITSTWSATPPMSTTRYWPEASLLNDGRVLVTGGFQAGDYKASTEIFDPRTGEWSAAGEMVRGRTQHTATTLPDGRVVVVGGRNVTELPFHFNSTEIYDPLTDSWALLPEPLRSRANHQASLLSDGSLLVTGGYNLRGQREDLVERLEL
jgi:hypothetical protein